jgi:hypothetical protein
MDAIQAGAMKFRIEYKLKAAIRYDDAAGIHVGWCPMLDIFSQGNSAEQAKQAVMSAATMYLRHCFRRGILNDVLTKRGFEPSDEPVTDTDSTSDSGEYISVRPEGETKNVFGDLFALDVPLDLIVMPQASRGNEACLS